MARLKSLRLKSREFIFTAYGNDREKVPAKIVFARFPRPGENFTPVTRRRLLAGVKAEDFQKEETRTRILDNLVGEFLENLKSGQTDYRVFFGECVDHFENLEYEEAEIVTVEDFFRILPEDAAHAIAAEAHAYAEKRDEFSMGE